MQSYLFSLQAPKPENERVVDKPGPLSRRPRRRPVSFSDFTGLVRSDLTSGGVCFLGIRQQETHTAIQWTTNAQNNKAALGKVKVIEYSELSPYFKTSCRGAMLLEWEENSSSVPRSSKAQNARTRLDMDPFGKSHVEPGI
ncbi:hypothetical protein CEXT_776181 [Caerostris extrusa]|uniref:Uncharacterized protein n=1 Tax=Caerostris extrusa TaxID=172846 RepID=A0AAV4NC75_CAEEX|nr:hypothetical protein CEXT_776181 [Caerostris extrusa]